MKRRRPQQLDFVFRSWGGRREGAGRKPVGSRAGVSHRRRPRLAARYPCHVTLKVRRELNNLRTKREVRVVRLAITRVCDGRGFRVIDWSVQSDHVHLMVEARDAERLSRGMQGLSIRIALGLNREVGRRGRVFADRYHSRILKTPREVRFARVYVLLNARRHAAQRGCALPTHWMDPCSSWPWFDGWRNCPAGWLRQARAALGSQRSTAVPSTWLMRVGWRRHGLIPIAGMPGG